MGDAPAPLAGDVDPTVASPAEDMLVADADDSDDDGAGAVASTRGDSDVLGIAGGGLRRPVTSTGGAGCPKRQQTAARVSAPLGGPPNVVPHSTPMGLAVYSVGAAVDAISRVKGSTVER